MDLGGRAPPEEAAAGAVGLGADHAPGAEAEEIQWPAAPEAEEGRGGKEEGRGAPAAGGRPSRRRRRRRLERDERNPNPRLMIPCRRE